MKPRKRISLASSNEFALSSNVAAKSLISLSAGLIAVAVQQSPATSTILSYFRACNVQQHPSCNVHPYGGRAGVPPPEGCALSPRGFGVEDKAEVTACSSMRAPAAQYLNGAYAGSRSGA